MFIGNNVKLSHYHEEDGKKLASWQWDEDFLTPLTSDMIHPYTAEDWEKYLGMLPTAMKMLNLPFEKSVMIV